MKKTIASIIVILLTVSAAVSASPFSVNIGTISEFQVPVGSQDILQADVIDVNNWAGGSEIRLTAAFLSLDAYMITKQGEIVDVVDGGEAAFADGIQQRVFGMADLSITTKVADFTTLSVGAGPAYGIKLYSGWEPEFWLYNEDNLIGQDVLSHLLDDFTLSYRARLDFSFSRFSYGISYSVSGIGPNDPYTPDWEKGKLAVSFITRVL